MRHPESGGGKRNRTALNGFAGRCITSLLPRLRGGNCNLILLLITTNKKGSDTSFLLLTGAGEESRTLDLNLGKVALYQLSYSRIKLLTTKPPLHRNQV